MKLYSQSFKTTTELTKEYKLLRLQLIKELGVTKHTRFLPQCFVLEIYGNEQPLDSNNSIPNPWLPYTCNKETMKERLKVNKNDLFRLSTAPLELINNINS